MAGMKSRYEIVVSDWLSSSQVSPQVTWPARLLVILTTSRGAKQARASLAGLPLSAQRLRTCSEDMASSAWSQGHMLTRTQFFLSKGFYDHV